jgi:hypothetical protein
MATSNRLKAWVRYDGKHKIVPSSLILRVNKPKVGTWREIPTDLCCQPTPNALRLFFVDLEEVNTAVGDITNVNDWNDFFDLPAFGNPFKSVEIFGSEVRLYGGSDITLQYGLFGFTSYRMSQNIFKVIDDAGCVISIEDAAFDDCHNLREVSFPEVTEVTYVDYYGAFGYCDNLKTAYLPKLKQLGGSGPFYGCDILKNLTLAFNEITQLGDDVFDSCYSLTSLSFPNLMFMGDGVFNGCSSLTSLNLPSLQAAGDYSFGGVSSLIEINLPSLTYIGNLGFYGCNSLATISLPSCINLGATVADNSVFTYITGHNITLTVPAALMTCNAGQPDGDIQYLQANNTVTVITV